MQHKFEGLYGVHIPDALRPGLTAGRSLPMRFINDATAFAIGESWMGEGRGLRKVVVITLGTGFGSAFLDDDVPIVQGAEVPPEGCLWHLPFRDGIADDYFSTRWFTQTYAEQSGHRVPGVKTLMDKAAADPVAGQLFETFGQNLAECLGPWLLRFGAEVLIVGGNIAHALPLFGPALRAGLQVTRVPARITPSVLWEKAALLGSARLLDDAFWAKVSVHLPTL
jgi:glucokinase